MPQTLQDKLYEQYKLRASESLRGGSKLAGRTQPAQLEPRPKVNIKDVGQYPEWYTPVTDETPASSMLNAVGVGLWSFVDTALFGIPGSLVEEEKFLEFEDPVAKWTGAVGGFAGFVGGAPLKVGAKIAQKGFGALARKIFDSDLALDQKMHLRYFAEKIDRICDLSEDIADEIQIYAIKRSV